MNSNIKIGRNDLCHCGSGKKYKKCCMIIEEQSSNNDNIINFSWKKLRRTEEEVIDDHLIPYAARTLPEDILDTAFLDLVACVELDEERYDAIWDSMFISWFLFNWAVEIDEINSQNIFKDSHAGKKNEDNKNNEKIEIDTIVSRYLKDYGSSLTKSQQSFIKAMQESYYSFYQIKSVVKNKSLSVRAI